MKHSKTPKPLARANPEAPKFRTFLGPILLFTNIFFLNFISRIIFAPLLPSIQKDLGLAHVEAASLFLFVSMGYSVSLLMSGFVSNRLQHRKTIVLSATAVGISLLSHPLMPHDLDPSRRIASVGVGLGALSAFRPGFAHRIGQRQALGKSHRHP